MFRRPQTLGSTTSGNWLVTYSDMVTLMMAFFVCIIAFAWKGEAGYFAGNNALPDGSVVWRPRTCPGKNGESGPRWDEIYRDPSAETSAQLVETLDEMDSSRPLERFTVRLPLNLFFAEGDRLSSSGMNLLHALAEQVRDLPYDLQFQVKREDEMLRAVALCGFLASRERCEPARLAVGTRPGEAEDGGSVWLVLFRQF